MDNILRYPIEVACRISGIFPYELRHFLLHPLDNLVHQVLAISTPPPGKYLDEGFTDRLVSFPGDFPIRAEPGQQLVKKLVGTPFVNHLTCTMRGKRQANPSVVFPKTLLVPLLAATVSFLHLRPYIKASYTKAHYYRGDE